MIVIDTNVLVFASGPDDARPACVEACAMTLADARRSRYVLDDGDVIATQYRANVADSRPHTVGYEFVIHVLQTQYDPNRCERVQLTADAGRTWVEFPDDDRLDAFDRSDRVFVAVGLGRAPVAVASDRGWWRHAAVLGEHGLDIRFLCPENAPKGRSPQRGRRP